MSAQSFARWPQTYFTSIMTVTEIKKYFIDRCDEIISLSFRGDPWVFLCGSAMIDYLTNMVTGNSNRVKYIQFIKDYFGQVNPAYKDFQYKNGFRDLPKQMYIILRCGIVHSFSFVPNHQGQANGGRTRSILLAHEKNGHAHFTKYRKNGMDAVVFTAEQFSKDLKTVAEIIFNEALTNQQLRQGIIQYITAHPPILGKFN